MPSTQIKELVEYKRFATHYKLPFSHNQLSSLADHAIVCLHPAITLVMTWHAMV